MGSTAGAAARVPQNDHNAIKWYRKAAEQGHAEAQFKVGLLYEKGRGLPRHYGKAAEWYLKAAEQNFDNAQYRLGILHDKGLGVEKNPVLAYMWTALAKASGNALAALQLDQIEKRMTPAQIAKAQEMAAKWRPKKAGSTK